MSRSFPRPQWIVVDFSSSITRVYRHEICMRQTGILVVRGRLRALRCCCCYCHCCFCHWHYCCHCCPSVHPPPVLFSVFQPRSACTCWKPTLGPAATNGRLLWPTWCTSATSPIPMCIKSDFLSPRIDMYLAGDDVMIIHLSPPENLYSRGDTNTSAFKIVWRKMLLEVQLCSVV